jgi:hypothetical protein
LKKLILLSFSLFSFLASAAQACQIYDQNGILKGYVGTGVVYDSGGTQQGHISTGTVYDVNHLTVGYVKNGAIYDADKFVIGRIVGEQVYNSNGGRLGTGPKCSLSDLGVGAIFLLL